MSFIPEIIPINEVHLILGGEPISFIGLKPPPEDELSDDIIPIGFTFLGHKHTEETKAEMKKSSTHHWLDAKFSEETKQLMRENHTKYWQGKTLSSEHREKIKQTKMKEPRLTCGSCGKTMNKPNFVKYGHSLKCS